MHDHGRHILTRTAVLALCLLGAWSSPLVAGKPFRMSEVVDGVHLVRPSDGSAARSNSLLVERGDGLLVVDAQPTEAAAEELLTLIETRFKQQIRYLVLSHSHAEAAGGASAFPKSTLVIGSRGYAEALNDETYDFGAEARLVSGEAWVEPARRLPDLVVFEKIALPDATNPVDLIALAPTHSRGDMLILLPDSNLVHVGALLVPDRNPYAGDANVGRWNSRLNSLARMKPDVIVALRGPALEVADVQAQRDALAWMRGQVEYGFINRPPLDQLRRKVLETPGIEKYFAIESPSSFVPVLVDRTIDEGVQSRRKRGRM